MEADPANITSPVCPGCVQRDRRIADLEARVQMLEQKLEAALRSGKRQAYAPEHWRGPGSYVRRPERERLVAQHIAKKALFEDAASPSANSSR